MDDNMHSLTKPKRSDDSRRKNREYNREYMRQRRSDPTRLPPKPVYSEAQKKRRSQQAREWRNKIRNDPVAKLAYDEENRARVRQWLESPANQERNRRRALTWQSNPDNQLQVRLNKRLAANRRRARLQDVENTFTKTDWQTLVARSKHCHWCKNPFTAKRRPTHDHVIPIKNGGTNTLVNSCCACRLCNSRKSAGSLNPITGQSILL